MRLLDKISDDAFQGVNVELKDITQQTIIQKKVVPYNQTFSTKMSFVSDKGLIIDNLT